MQAFTVHTGKVAVLNRGNIDTDQIIPKEHLKSIARTGFGPALFSHWRYLADGTAHPDFELNQPEAKGASILLTGNNFGCGSSREHAVWAIMQDGYRAVIAPSKNSGQGEKNPAFADIFKNNAFKNGLLTIELAEIQMKELLDWCLSDSQRNMTIDLASQSLQFGTKKLMFEIDGAKKEILLKGLDDIGRILQYEAEIKKYEAMNVGSGPCARP